MNYYQILPTNDPTLGYVVFSVSYVNPLTQQTSVELDLRKSGYFGHVLFDLLLSNGNTSNRFLKLYFDGQKLALNTAQRIEKICADLEVVTNSFYQNNFDRLDTTILPKPLKYRLKKEIR